MTHNYHGQTTPNDWIKKKDTGRTQINNAKVPLFSNGILYAVDTYIWLLNK